MSMLILSCQEKKSNAKKMVESKTIEKDLTQSQTGSTIEVTYYDYDTLLLNLTEKQLDSIEAIYYEYDTLLLEEYISENGHTIKKRGSLSRFLYRISTKSKKGIKRDFDITDNSYVASHSTILWDNEDFIFVRYGCGSPCWGGLVLSLNNEDEIKDFEMYLYEDSLNNLVVYPDEDWENLVLENFSTGQTQKEKFEFCEKLSLPLYAIEEVINKSPKSVEVIYTTSGCELTKKKIIEIK